MPKGDVPWSVERIREACQAALLRKVAQEDLSNGNHRERWEAFHTEVTIRWSDVREGFGR